MAAALCTGIPAVLSTSIHPPRLGYLAVLRFHLAMHMRLLTTSREDAA